MAATLNALPAVTTDSERSTYTVEESPSLLFGALQVDQMLVARLAEGDISAMAELYDRQAPSLFGVLMRVLGNRADAEDALQEVFLRVWRRARSYDPALGAPGPWLRGVARNYATDRLRRRRTWLNVGPDDWPAIEHVAPRADPERLAMRGEQNVTLWTSLLALAPEERLLIEWAYFRGYSHQELALRFATPLGTVKTRIRRGMTALRVALQAGRESQDARTSL